MILELICSKNYHPMRAKDMAALLQIPKGKRKDLLQVLDALEEEGRSPAVSGGCIAGQRRNSLRRKKSR